MRLRNNSSPYAGLHVVKVCSPPRCFRPPRSSSGDQIGTSAQSSQFPHEQVVFQHEDQSSPQKSKPLTWDEGLVSGLQSSNLVTALIKLIRVKCTNSHPNRATLSDLCWSFLGSFLAVGILGIAAEQVKSWPGVGIWHQQGLNLLIGSFGTLSVLLFARPEAEAIKVWNLIMGQLVSTSIALATILVFGSSIFSRALAMGLAISAMMITDSVHPPGGALVLLVADSAVIHTTMGGWFLIYPSLAFTFAVMLPIGALVNHLKRCWRFDFSMIHEIKATTQPQSIWEVTHPPQEGSDGGHLKTT